MFTHHLYILISSCFISFVSKWDFDSFHSQYLHFSVKQFYQFCVQMRLWLISLTISTLSHPTVLWSWCPHPTVSSVWWPNEIVTYFTHFLYTLVSDLRLWLIPPNTTICRCTCLCVDAMLACRLCLIHISEHCKIRAKHQHVCKEMNQYTINANRKWILSFGIDWTIGMQYRK